MDTRKAYVLIQTETGKSQQVMAALTGRPGITAVDLVVGPHDIIAVIQGSDADSIAKVVVNAIQSVKGVYRTTTYMVINPA